MPLSLKLPWPLFGPPRPRFTESAPDDLVLCGPRVRLRPLRPSDTEALFACASDSHVTAFLPWHPATGLNSVASFLDDQVARRLRGESLGLAILRESELIGSVDLMGLRAAHKTGVAEIGYLLRHDCWGHGLMTEAASLARDHAFTVLGVRVLIAFADEDNAGSRRVLEKLGMRYVSKEWRTIKGRERRYVRYELKREDEELLH